MKYIPIYFTLVITLVFGSHHLFSQTYPDYFGAGHDLGVTISSSSEVEDNEASNTLSGTGYLPDLVGASRFLGQASLGANYDEIEYVTQIGVEAWIDEQMSLPYTSYRDKLDVLESEINQLIQTVHPGQVMDRPGEFTSFIFYEAALKDIDVLRTKAAFSLLQILVVSRSSIVLGMASKGHASYFDTLREGAFGNFRDMLESVSLHTMMGYYLSHLQNEKGDPELGTLPDENYAREIMQLFSIGLFELNIDGSYKLDNNGERIPTYDIEDIQELAKVFTGLSGGAYNLEEYPDLAGQAVRFNRPLRVYDITVPMMMYEEYHDQGEKVMIDGTIIPAGQPGIQDIQMALDVLFNHPNVGPFLAFRLIQQMVKSNPSPAYIKRVATAFNNNGQGVRGDMAAVFRAVLLDPEARDCAWLDDPSTGKLKQPIERLTQLFRAFDIDSPSGNLWFNDTELIRSNLGQAFMASPTVFNFWTPFYAEDEYVAPNDMVSPEFQVLHAVTAINYLNFMETGLQETPFPNRTRVNNNNPRLRYNTDDNPFLNFDEEIELLENEGISALLDRLSLILCHGRLSEKNHNTIQSTLEQYKNDIGFSSKEIVESALYFIMVSPDFVILE